MCSIQGGDNSRLELDAKSIRATGTLQEMVVSTRKNTNGSVVKKINALKTEPSDPSRKALNQAGVKVVRPGQKESTIKKGSVVSAKTNKKILEKDASTAMEPKKRGRKKAKIPQQQPSKVVDVNKMEDGAIAVEPKKRGRKKAEIPQQQSSKMNTKRLKAETAPPATNQTRGRSIPFRESVGSSPKAVKAPRLTKKVLSAYEEETIGIRPVDRGSSWDGNSEADGSVNSGVLDENQCFECGVYAPDEDWSKVALCDVCDGEYHMACSGLEQLPRLSWTCTPCREERDWFKHLSYGVHSFFKVCVEYLYAWTYIYVCIYI